jgi:ABC-type multidrug transport system fused ATPase/permease subunit
MEYLNSEKLININDRTNGNIEEEKDQNKNGDENTKNEPNEHLEENQDEQEKNIDGEYTTDFTDKIELTEEERNLRQNYLKKVSRKEALFRSVILGKKSYIVKIFNFVISIIYDVLNFKETKYKSDAINAITAKDLDKFIISVKYHLITKFLNRLTNHFETKFFNYFFIENQTRNIMLENILLKKDMVFFDLFKTGELNNKVQLNKDFPNFNIIETCTKIGEYIFKICYFGYYLYKDFFEMSAIYMTIVMIQIVAEPFLFNDFASDDMIEKLELRDNYINDILSNIRLVKSFATEKKKLKRLVNIIGKIKEQGFWKKFFQESYNQLYSINFLFSFLDKFYEH